MVFKWKEDHTPLFLKYYENYPCLWDFRIDGYKDRDMRSRAAKSLLKDLNIIGVTEDDIKLKIKSIRTRYTAELKKIKRSRLSSEEDLYVPKLFWFKQADRFLNAVCIPRETALSPPRQQLCSIQSSDTSQADSSLSSCGTGTRLKRKHSKITTEFQDVLCMVGGQLTAFKKSPSLEEISESSDSALRSDPSLSAYNNNRELKTNQSNNNCIDCQEVLWVDDERLETFKKDPSTAELNNLRSTTTQEANLSSWGNNTRLKNNQANNSAEPQEVLCMIEDRLTTLRPDDECDIIGKNVAAKLRSMLPIQKIYAEKIINDTLYEAQLNNLGRFSRLSNPT